jgi:hypothetical protein
VASVEHWASFAYIFCIAEIARLMDMRSRVRCASCAAALPDRVAQGTARGIEQAAANRGTPFFGGAKKVTRPRQGTV